VDDPGAITVRETIDGTWIEGTALSSLEPALRTVIGIFAGQREHWRAGYAVWVGWGPLDLAARDGGYVITTPDYGPTADPRRAGRRRLRLVHPAVPRPSRRRVDGRRAGP